MATKKTADVMIPSTGKLPKTGYVGEFHFEDKVVSIYSVGRDGQLYEALEYGRGQYVAKSEVIPFEQIEKFKTYRVSASQTVSCWRFKGE